MSLKVDEEVASGAAARSQHGQRLDSGDDVENKDNTSSPREIARLPWKKVTAICLIQYTNSFSLTVVYPFLPFMVHDFFPYLQSSELGFYAGFLGGAFSAGSIFGNIIWGRFSDRHGRRPALLLGILGTVVFIMLFGFSISFIWAVSFRFLWGLFNGNTAVAKTYLSEICDDTNVAKGFSLLGTAGAVARLTAPAVSGFLSCAAVKYHGLNVPVLKNFPYLLPCLISAGLCVLTWLAAFVYLKETLRKGQRSSGAGDSSDDVDWDGRSSTSKPLAGDDLPKDGPLKSRDRERSPYIVNRSAQIVFCWLCSCCCQHRYERLNEEQKDSCCRKCRCGITNVCSPLKDRRVFLAVSIQCLLSFCGSIQAEILPLLLVTNYQHGGYDFDTTEISLLYSMMAIPETVYQIVIYPKTVRILGLKRVLQIGFLVGACFFALIPSINRMTGPIIKNCSNTHDVNALRPARSVVMAIDPHPLIVPVNESRPSSSELAKLYFQSSNDDDSDSSRDPGEADGMLTGNRIKTEHFNESLNPDNESQPKDGLKLLDEYTTTQATAPARTQSDPPTAEPWTNITTNLIKQCKILSDINDDGPVPLQNVPMKVWVVLFVIVSGSTLARMTTEISSTIITGNSCLSKDKGTVYGIAQSMTSALRSVGPAAGGSFFAWTEEKGLPWPLSYHLTFYLVFVILNVISGVCFFLPNSINKKRVEEDENQNLNRPATA